MLRLDSAHPPLWRTATCLQFGPDAVAVVDDPTPWQERIVRALEGGLPDAVVERYARALGAAPEQAARFLATLAPALRHDGERHTATIDAPADIPVEALEQVAGVFVEAGIACADGGSGDGIVVLLAHRFVLPARWAALMRDDVAHLPIVLGGTRVDVGPLVIPGQTCCLACVDAYRTDADAAWPVIAPQLLGRTPPETPAALLVEAAYTAARLLANRGAETDAGTAVTLRADDPRPQWRRYPPHPRCGCRSL